jgi:ATPase subunit of ABC transporter with duplicated ATPase domains
MVIVSHDREFLDQLCTKIVHTEFGLAHTFAGNYTRFTNAREEAVAQQWAAWEKQQKEIARQVGADGQIHAQRCCQLCCAPASACAGLQSAARLESSVL